MSKKKLIKLISKLMVKQIALKMELEIAEKSLKAAESALRYKEMKEQDRTDYTIEIISGLK